MERTVIWMMVCTILLPGTLAVFPVPNNLETGTFVKLYLKNKCDYILFLLKNTRIAFCTDTISIRFIYFIGVILLSVLSLLILLFSEK